MTFKYVRLNDDGIVINKIISAEPREDLIEVDELPEDREWFWAFNYNTQAWVDIRTDDIKWSEIRAVRNELLAASDWTQLPDSPLSSDVKAQWSTYRVALRDITTQPIDNITWPTPPA